MNKARRLLHRDSAPILSFSGFGAKKNEERRKSDINRPALPPQPVQQVNLPRFYVRGINRDGAEDILYKQPVGTFLVRDRESATSSGCYTLSLRHKVGLKHHKIETHPSSNKLIIAGYERFQFDTLEELTEFFVKSQKKDIALVPYDPEGVCNRMSSMTIEQPSYEEMDAPEHCENDEMYLRMDEGCLIESEMPRRTPYQNENRTPPVPSRKDSGQQSYENLNRPQRGVQRGPSQCHTAPRQRYNGYENILEKGTLPSPVDPSAPPIPPRIPQTSGQGYENMPGKSHSLPQAGSYENAPPRSSPRLPRNSYQNVPDRSPPIPQRSGYQNVPDRSPQGPPIPERRPGHGPGYENYGNTPTGYENYFSKSGSRLSSSPQPAASHGHSYQNLPPKVAPRRATTQVTNFSAEQSLPRKPAVPIRRVKTDTERDYHARRK